MVVTEGMLTEVAEVGDLGQLQVWGRQGVRVKTVEPLFAATLCGFLDLMRCLVWELGADVNQTTRTRSRSLIAAIPNVNLSGGVPS
jgi:hypothetical protein